MSKPKSIQINIPNPCSQNWDEMTPNAQGRFCGQCQKTVIDFTTWSDAALYNFFSKNTGHICGRYLATQVSRPINIPYQPHSRLYMLTIALGLTLTFSPAPHLLAQARPPLIAQTDTSQKKKPTENQFGSISGRVLDEKKEPMINAAVQVFMNNIARGGAITDYDGNYAIQPLEPCTYSVVIRYAGYDSCLATDVLVEKGRCTARNFQMQKPSGVILHQFIRMGGPMPLINFDVPATQPDVPHTDTINIDTINNSSLQKRRKDEKIKLDTDNPTKRTFTREDIDHLPH